MNDLRTHLAPALRLTALLTVLLGLLYPLAVTGLAQLLFPRQANGSLLVRDGTVVGSRLLGQPFAGPRYFHPRPSSAGAGYDAMASSPSNLGPASAKLDAQVAAAAAALHRENPATPIPVDLATGSASGLDPHITPAGAAFQIPRVARARGLSEDEVRRRVEAHTEGRQWGVLGEPRVNVLELNLDLDRLAPARSPR